MNRNQATKKWYIFSPTVMKLLPRLAVVCLSVTVVCALPRDAYGQAAGTVAAYGLNEGNGTQTVDASGNNNTGTLSAATWTTGKFGAALAFNGTSSRVTVPDSPSLRPSSALSLGVWIFPNGTPQPWGSIVHKVHATNFVSYGLGQNSSNLRRLSGYLQVNGARYTTPATTALADRTWYYVVLSWQSGQPLTLTVYTATGAVFNTKSTTQAPTGTITYDTRPLHVGEDEAGDNWSGTIDEVRIYNRVLSPAEISTNMTTAISGSPSGDTTPPSTPTNVTATATSNSQINLGWTASTDNVGVTSYGVERCQGNTCTNFTQVATPTTTTHSDTGLTANTTYRYRVRARDAANNASPYSSIATATTLSSPPPPPPAGGAAATYYFDEGNGTQTVDASGNNNTGTLSAATWTTGKFGAALAFNGTSSRVTVPDSPSLRPSSALSLGVWIFPNGTPQPWGSIVHKVHATNFVSYGLGQNSSNLRRLSGYLQVNGARYTTPATTALADRTWYYVVLSWQSGQPLTLTVYTATGAVFNTKSTTQAPTGTITYDTRPLHVGEDEAGDNWSGTIDELRIYSRTRSASEIQADMKISGGTSAQSGLWTAPVSWPLVAVSTALLPTGQVLIWDGQNYGTDARLWNPATGAFTSVPSSDNLFCAGHSLLRDGRTLVAGGHATGHLGIVDTNIFNHSTRTWTSAPPMGFPRWYPTTTVLPNGRVLVTAGEIGCNSMPPDGSFRPECVADIPEVYDPATNSWTRLANARLAIPYYPHMFVLPDGKVLNTSTAEGPVPARVLDVATQSWTIADPVAVDGGSAAMYLPGKVIKSGTSTNPDNPSVATQATTYVLDVTRPSPAWRQVASMAFPRAYHYLTLLPDGTFLATGGSRVTDVFNLGAAVLPAEVWSPVTEQWTTLASMTTPRVYHSTALLLPDGRVLLAGGGRYGVDQFSAELYSPPYLFKGPRPTITTAPTTLQYGTNFSVSTPDAASISKVSLLRLGASTHAFNFDQRFLPLTFQVASGALSVQAPANANLAPPGYYMLFIVNTSGVPSVASMVRFP